MAKLALRSIVYAALAAVAPVAMAGEPHTAPNAPPPAKVLFGSKPRPTAGAAASIGFYSRGCLAGGVELPIDGPHWQVMRLSRNRNWGHPDLVRTIKHLAERLPKIGGWDGILVGDMSQPRGGPMLTGHASHQIGLDADIWLTPWPDHRLSRDEREQMSAWNILTTDWMAVNPDLWTPQHEELVKAAADEPAVERVLVNPAVKKALCRHVHGERGWLDKVRPFYLHQDHIHVRIKCPAGHSQCRPQPPVVPGDGCGKDLAWWFAGKAHSHVPEHPRPPLKLADLPAACVNVLHAPSKD
jgi:penicillin-insensitive murein endopeptidase